MGQTQNMRKREDVMKEEMIVEDMVIHEVLEKLIDITHLLNQQEIFMHLKIP